MDAASANTAMSNRFAGLRGSEEWDMPELQHIGCQWWGEEYEYSAH